MSYTEDELLNILKSIYRNTGKIPKAKDFKKPLPSYTKYIRIWGSWNKALESANIKPRKTTRKRKYSKEEIKQIIIDWTTKNNRVPTSIEFYEDEKLPNPSYICYKFNMKWNDVLKSIGLNLKNKRNKSLFNSISDNELLLMLKNELERVGNTNLNYYMENKKENMPSFKVYKNRFEIPWSELLKLLSFETNVNNFINYTDEELIKIFKNEIKRIGSTKYKDFEQNRNKDTPSPSFYRRHFNMKWSELIKKFL